MNLQPSPELETMPQSELVAQLTRSRDLTAQYERRGEYEKAYAEFRFRMQIIMALNQAHPGWNRPKHRTEVCES